MTGDAQDWAGSLLPLLQICDSALPTGAFAHTFGMETYLERGTVSDQASFQDWLERFLDHQLVYADGLAVRLTAELFAVTTANGASAGAAPSALAAADGAASAGRVDLAALTGRADLVVEGQFGTRDALPARVGVADQMDGRGSQRIGAAIFGLEGDAAQRQVVDGGLFLRRQAGQGDQADVRRGRVAPQAARGGCRRRADRAGARSSAWRHAAGPSECAPVSRRAACG